MSLQCRYDIISCCILKAPVEVNTSERSHQNKIICFCHISNLEYFYVNTFLALRSSSVNIAKLLKNVGWTTQYLVLKLKCHN